MKKMHGLVISWFYPPGNSSEGLVTYKLLKNSSFTFDVFTRKSHDADMFDRRTDESRLTSDNVEVFKATTNDPQEWAREALSFYKRCPEKYDFVMTRCMIAVSHYAGALIKKNYPKTLWLASFGDPLVNSPYIRDINASDNPFSIWHCSTRVADLLRPTRFMQYALWEKQRKKDMIETEFYRRINRETFQNADVLIFNNPYQLEHAFQDDEYAKYRNKGVVINHSFDLELYPKKSKERDDKLHFVYVGHLDSMRSAQPLLMAIGMLKRHDKRLADKVAFDFYGHIDEADKVTIMDQKVYDTVHLHPDINYLDSLQKISDADWTILIDANLNNVLDNYIFFPAKLADYLGARKSILAITQPHGISADILNSVGAGQLVTHSADEIFMYLSKIIYQGYSPACYNEHSLLAYDAKNTARKFDQLVVANLK